MEDAACQLERDHVHNVYEKIAPFFNDSRYKAWPKVRKFLLEQEPGSIVADVGKSAPSILITICLKPLCSKFCPQ